MNLSRRGFLQGVLAAAAAPAILKVAPVMRLWVPSQELLIPEAELHGAFWPGVNTRANWFAELYGDADAARVAGNIVKTNAEIAYDAVFRKRPH